MLIYLFIYLLISLFIFLPICMFVFCLSVCLSICFYLSIVFNPISDLTFDLIPDLIFDLIWSYLSVHLSFFLSVCLTVYLFIYLSICPSTYQIYQSIRQSVYLSIDRLYPSIHPSLDSVYWRRKATPLCPLWSWAVRRLSLSFSPFLHHDPLFSSHPQHGKGRHVKIVCSSLLAFWIIHATGVTRGAIFPCLKIMFAATLLTLLRYCQIPEASTPVPDDRVEQGLGTRFDMSHEILAGWICMQLHPCCERSASFCGVLGRVRIHFY